MPYTDHIPCKNSTEFNQNHPMPSNFTQQLKLLLMPDRLLIELLPYYFHTKLIPYKLRAGTSFWLSLQIPQTLRIPISMNHNKSNQRSQKTNLSFFLIMQPNPRPKSHERASTSPPPRIRNPDPPPSKKRNSHNLTARCPSEKRLILQLHHP